ncbi:helix-turn-helix domain-containing protein [Paenibacillus sp. 481]|uniref:helix-turn-helix domain-containing protein n=1 Tax=Paenibacillus sp. 481 TaxID=2835869 RepID=UPI001E54764E|nr:MerR family transcriptional regulator [Paenibacillus sp. 481]UHA72607.1 MerR family transcriptional regulator [Paenibacillus sp. 481]
MGDENNQLYRIGELARMANVNQRTIDYYTTIGLVQPAQRTATNYRLYNAETIERLQRINQMKQEKYTLEEIKQYFQHLSEVATDDISQRLTDLQLHLQQVEREVRELQPMLERLKPKQAEPLFNRLSSQSAACVEVLMTVLDRSSTML